MKSILSTIFLCWMMISSYGQDIHFSQMDLNAAMRNPATLGQMVHNNKLSASYRTQWSSLPSTFRNINLAFEQRKSNFSWGTSILHNDAGRKSLRNTQMLLNFSYQRRLSERDEVIAIGVSGGVIQQRFQPELFLFDNQYVAGNGVDAARPNGENFIRTKQFLPTATAGIFMSKYLGKIKMSGGVSFAHLTRPASEFIEGEKEYYPIRSSFFGSAQFFIRKKVKWDIRFAWNQQLIADEKIVGARLQYELSPDTWLVAGAASRMGDAYILEGGMKFKNGSVVLSYDINNSALVAATNTKGALELGVTYMMSKREAYKQTQIAAPFASDENDLMAEKEEEKQPSKVLDTDGDGVVDNMDECPTVAGLLHFNGCNDTDRDGVWDSKDACPHLYGDKMNQGCPTIQRDSDKDGLLDNIDKCPYLRGTAEMGGCPDSDKDGVSDMLDKCPFLKGEKNNNGCPNMNREVHQEFIRKKSANALVEFTTSYAVVEPQFFAPLEEVAMFLLGNPKAKAFISGHTDDEGNSEFNYRLGEQRAMAVMEYLLEVGVSPDQMSTISYGEFKPINTNKSEYEKAKNRRVEVTVYAR